MPGRKTEYFSAAETGGLQVVNVEEQMLPEKMPETKDSDKRLFDAYKDAELQLKLGVPEILVPLVRQLRQRMIWTLSKANFPRKPMKLFSFCRKVFSMDDILKDMAKEQVPETVDTADFVTALNNPDSKGDSVFVEGAGTGGDS